MPMPNSEYHQCPSKQEQIDIARSSQKIVYDIDPNVDLQMSTEDYGKLREKLETTQNRNSIGYAKSLFNLHLIVRADKTLQGIWYNELTDQIEVHGAPPWDRDDTSLLWDDRDTINLREYIYNAYSIEYSKQDVEDYALILAYQHRFNPLKKYLEQLPAWDGHPRIDTLFVDYLGAEDTEYVHEVSRLLFRAAIKRIYQPGCKYDYMTVLIGRQGTGKSTLLAKLGGDFYTDRVTFADMASNDGGKALGEKLHGNWIIEVSELSGIRKSEIEAVKGTISATEDLYREAYGRKAKKYPRSNVFIGTSNDDTPLVDATGNRRFLIIKCDASTSPARHPWDLTQDEIDQIWAEAYALYSRNLDAPLVLSKASTLEAEAHQREALDTNNWEGRIGYYLDQKLPQNWNEGYNLGMRLTYLHTYSDDDPAFLDSDGNDTRVQRTEVSIPEIWCECLGKDLATLKRGDSMQIKRALTKLGWTRGAKGTDRPESRRLEMYGKQRMFYRRPSAPTAAPTVEATPDEAPATDARTVDAPTGQAAEDNTPDKGDSLPADEIDALLPEVITT